MLHIRYPFSTASAPIRPFQQADTIRPSRRRADSRALLYPPASRHPLARGLADSHALLYPRVTRPLTSRGHPHAELHPRMSRPPTSSRLVHSNQPPHRTSMRPPSWKTQVFEGLLLPVGGSRKRKRPSEDVFLSLENESLVSDDEDKFEDTIRRRPIEFFRQRITLIRHLNLTSRASKAIT
jgi:hypothetical protein